MSIARSIVQPISTGRRIWDHILKYDPVEIYNNNFDGGKDSWKDFNSGQGVVSAVASYNGRTNVIFNSVTSPRTGRLGAITTGVVSVRCRGWCFITAGASDGLAVTNVNPNSKVWQDIQKNPPIGSWFQFDLVGLTESTGEIPNFCPITGDTLSSDVTSGIYFDDILIEQLQP
jgi:hypothetical protein